MACPHAAFGDPATCSQCIATGAPVIVRHVSQLGSALLVDGAPAGRPIEPVRPSGGLRQAARRGGQRRRPKA